MSFFSELGSAVGAINRDVEVSSVGVVNGGGEGSGVGAVDGEGDGVVVVSTLKVTVLLASFSSWLLLPAVSANLLFWTWIMPFVVLFAVGVKVAV